jgi:hypothetical protein
MFIHPKPRYTISDLLSLLSIGRAGLYADINCGKLVTYTIGKRRFVKPEELDKYVETCETGAAQ